jgi:hypothetical protein
MSGFAQVFLLELRLRRAVFFAALVAGIIPIPMAWIMSRNFGFSEVLNAGAFAFALIGGELLALYLGATVLCKDLSEARSGFFFSRPLAGWALWAGKFSAAWTVVLGAMLVCLLPTTFMGGGLASLKSPDNPFWTYDVGPRMLSPLWMPLLVALAVLLLMAFAHAASVMRSSSPWIILDVVMVVLLPALAWWAFRRVLTFQTPLLFMVLIVALAVGLLVGLLAAGAAQTVSGRADLRRGHRVLSLTLWSILAACVLAADGYAFWATAVSPKDLLSVRWVSTAPTGPWVLIVGGLKHRGPYAGASFLVNVQARTYRSVGGARWGSGVAFSPNGKLAVAFETPFSFDNGPSELVSYDLSGPEIPQPARHAITISSAWESGTAFSPDSSRLALFSDDTLSVYELPSWKLVAAQRLGSLPSFKGSPRLMFLDRDHVRILKGVSDGPNATSDGTSILEFNVARKTLQETGHVPAQCYTLRWDSSHGRMLAVFQQNGTRQLALCEAQTGAVLKVLTEWGPHYPMASFMGDGRILSAERGNAQSFLRLFSSEGELLRTCPMGASRIAVAGPKVWGAKVVVETWERETKIYDEGDVRLFDPATGDLRILPGLRPTHSIWFRSDEAGQGPAGGVTSSVFPDDKGQLVSYDFQSGKVTPVKF